MLPLALLLVVAGRQDPAAILGHLLPQATELVKTVVGRFEDGSEPFLLADAGALSLTTCLLVLVQRHH